MLAIYKREVRSYFQSMVGCVFVAFLIAFTGIYFMAYTHLRKRPKPHQREMVRIWIAFLHQKMP